MSSRTPELAMQSQFIRAGAGAGKTTRLIQSFIDFALSFKEANGRWPRVVMTTFTRKATQEVKERLLVKALEIGHRDLFEYINQKNYVHISTIHGLLNLLLVQAADELQFPQEIKILDGVPAEKILKKHINELFKQKAELIELLELYSFQELVRLARQALDAKAECTNFKYISAEELKKFRKTQKDKLAQAIESILNSTVPDKAAWVNYFSYLQTLKQVLSTDDQTALQLVLDEMPQKPRWSEDKPSLDPIAHGLVLEFQALMKSTHLESDDFIQQHEKINSLFYQFICALEQKQFAYKQQTGQLTIADLELMSLQLIQKAPQAVQDFSDTWDYFMVDEYQDTSPLQVKILNAIIADKPCFIVGDPQQSIYLFRGARSEVFNIKEAEMKARGAPIDFLNVNYRSEPTLMNYLNQLVTDMNAEQFSPMQTKPQAASTTRFEADAFYINTEDISSGVLQHILYLKSKGVKAEDICVLSRQNRILEKIAYRAGQIGLPVQLQAAVGFESKREILDLMSFNRFLVNPHDDENMITLLRSPWLPLTDAELLDLAQIREQKRASYWWALNQTESEVLRGLKSYLQIYEVMGVLAANQHFLQHTGFLYCSQYYDHTGKREANIFKFLNTLADAEKKPQFSLGLFLEEQFQALQSDLGSGMGEAQPVEQPQCVSLMTVHASKGLQFKHVILIGLTDKINTTKSLDFAFDEQAETFSLAAFDNEEQSKKPSSWSLQLRRSLNKRELMESERVFYVAVTRAVESLSLVRDTSKNPDIHTWYRKIKWSELEIFDGEGYKTRALTYSESELTDHPVLSELQPKVRAAFQVLQQESASVQSVTELLSATFKTTKEFTPTRQFENLKKAKTGTDMHRLFEAMKYQSLDTWVAALPQVDQEAIAYLFSENKLPMKELIRHGHNEWGFGLRTTKKYIQGQIDLWAELENEIHVLDYKTGSPDYSDKAFEQLGHYTQALLYMKQISLNKKIIHSVVYPLDQSTKQNVYENASAFLATLAPELKESFQ